MKQLIEHGEVRRGRVGVAIQELTPDIAEALGISETHGAVVGSVERDTPRGPGRTSGGDVIVAVDKHPISGSADLRNRVGLAPVGPRSTKPQDNHAPSRAQRARTTTLAPCRGALEGAHFQDPGGNVVVASVDEGSAAAWAGLETGDVIVAVNRRPVTNGGRARVGTAGGQG
ncbi:PDZ domain-containing protein [Sinorhizobium psoraleae]|uniref:PDZ domain-containing protein n=1 Tax=Sinorhizobium psoraleae TaxID=520838 RepID=UPI001FE7EDC8|nr:PDZ domain-containing protein [Sinorhizobium psoraleae]